MAGPATNLDLYENTVWLIIITMTTVGYGGAPLFRRAALPWFPCWAGLACARLVGLFGAGGEMGARSSGGGG